MSESTGWRCPVCGAVWSPWVVRCGIPHLTCSDSANMIASPSATYPRPMPVLDVTKGANSE